MNITHKDIKKGEVKVVIESKDDLWYLNTIIEPGDIVSGKTLRKIKLGEGSDQNTKVIKKAVFIAISVEKSEYLPESLKLNGKVTDGPEDVPRGSYHSFTLEEGTKIMITKQKWLKYQLDKLDEAVNSVESNILMVVFDREEAHFAKMTRNGYEYLMALKGDVAKKADADIKSSNFYSQILAKIKDYSDRMEGGKVIVASPSFWKDEFMKELKDDALKKKIILAGVSAVDKTSFNELIKRDEVAVALKQERAADEIKSVEALMVEISRGELAAYGIEEVRKAVDAGAVTALILTDKCILDAREAESYDEIEAILKNVESMGGKIHIISSEHEGGQKLDGIGGIGAILRYRIS